MPASDARDIYTLGGWVFRDGTILPKRASHAEMAKSLGYADYDSAKRDGAIAVLRAPTHHFNCALFIRVHSLDEGTRSTLKDFIASTPSELANVGIFVEWLVDRLHRGGEAFSTVEEALAWLDRTTAGRIDLSSF